LIDAVAEFEFHIFELLAPSLIARGSFEVSGHGRAQQVNAGKTHAGITL
jgi:hypothetical protein